MRKLIIKIGEQSIFGEAMWRWVGEGWKSWHVNLHKITFPLCYCEAWSCQWSMLAKKKINFALYELIIMLKCYYCPFVCCWWKEIEGELVRLRAEPSVISNFQLCLIIIQTFYFDLFISCSCSLDVYTSKMYEFGIKLSRSTPMHHNDVMDFELKILWENRKSC